MSAPTRSKPSLIAAAQRQGQPSQPQAQAQSTSTSNQLIPSNLASIPMSTVSSSQSGSGAGSISARSTPAPGARAEGSVPPGGVQRMKFKPKVPIRRVKQEVDVKPDVSSIPTASPSAARGGAARGAPRGRGGPGRGRGRGNAPSTSIAAGVFGGPRPVAAASSSRRFAAAAAPTTRGYDEQDAEVYSDHSDTEGGAGRPIDIDLVSTMSESAPTSLFRDRRLNQDKKAKGKDEKQEKQSKKKSKSKLKSKAAETDDVALDVDPDLPRVKDEPISPEKRAAPLREDDTMLSDDELQDRDDQGRRVRNFAQTGGNDSPLNEDEDEEEVNEAQMVDLSESEEEEEEEDMEGDFVQAEGFDNPEEKLFIFQFPHLFPKFLPSTPVDLTQTDTKPDITASTTASTNGTAHSATNGPLKDVKPDIKPDVKPTPAQLRAGAKKGPEPVPEGRVGTMVVMKSGKVKIVMGKDIVMNVTPGLPTTFIQHLVHLEHKTKSAQVLGEIHKNYIVTPDIDRLLEELYINGGQTPGEVETERRKRLLRENRGLVAMKKERD
ncbi:uncharacterized protein I303_108171 [Kwoniella dejecticola CBS 10117]|uniref:DNA-directed RNA polymerase III subunit RPC4 n=1 Tax=Kwoniella dejecticola CBS 10117 TaxID=1296121 RepID=A0A1A5ZY49_9TREE|nr:DNA-directed RNA polymerase III subunit RPC4 [Kwoniella dejecticola CBS 10117]OBR82736.1 DNA-directed RNA polymerase III subunit RPC4 [Kwoniella dejecticola CBS 10117]